MIRAVTLLAVAVLFASPDPATACTWLGAGATPLWSDPANWTCPSPDVLPQNGATLTFPGGGRPDSQNDLAGLEVVDIIISGTGTGNIRYTISGLPIAVEAVSISASPDAVGAGPDIQARLVINDPTGPLTTAGSSVPTFGDIEIPDGHQVNVIAATSDIIIAGTISGPGLLQKYGSGTLFLQGHNTYDGSSVIFEGTVVLQSATALGTTAAQTQIAPGASAVVASPVTIAEPFTLSGAGVANAGVLQASADATLTGPIVFSAAITVAVAANATLTVTNSMKHLVAYEVIKQGAGRLVLAHPDNQWTRMRIHGGVVRSEAAGAFPATASLHTIPDTRFDIAGVSQTIGRLEDGDGTIDLGGGTLTVTQTADSTWSGVITGSGGFVKAGPSNLTLFGSGSNTYTGTMTIAQGTLTPAKQNGATAIPGPLVIEPAGILLLQVSHEQIADTSEVTVHGAISINGGTETIGALSGAGGIFYAVGSLAVGANHASTTFTGHLFGLGEFRKVGAGALTLTGNSAATFTGLTEVASGSLIVDGTLPSAKVIGGVLGGAGSVGTIDVYAAGALDPGSPAITPGLLSASTVTIGSGGTLAVEINGVTPGVGADQMSAANVTLDGAVLQASLGFTPSTGTTFTIVNVNGGAAVSGTFAGLPQDASFLIAGRPFRISYTGGDGNDIVLTALAPLAFSISDVSVIEGDTGSTNAVFTVSLPQPAVQTVSVQYATIDDTATSPADYTPVSGTLTFLPGTQTQTITVAVHGDTIDEPDETFIVRLSNAQGGVTIADSDGIGTIAKTVALTWYLAEGATGPFFDNDVLIANATSTDAPMTLTFFKQDGTTVVTQETIAANSRVTVHVDDIPGLEAAAASVEVKSTAGVPLIVERTMFWDQNWYGGHTGTAVDRPETTWYFAEANQGFFSTFVLVTNANASDATVTLTFLRENEATFVTSIQVAAMSRATIDAASFAELQGRSFAIVVESTQPVIAERAMYFGTTATRLWSGGHASAGVAQTSTSWFHAEGATGSFFDTFILLGNPGDASAQVRLDFLTEDSGTVEVFRTVPAKGRMTVPIESLSDPRLQAGAVSTVITSDRPIVSERSTYWAGESGPWGEGHNSFGLTQTATSWGLAEGRSGGPHGFATYILLANANAAAAEVTITYLRETGAPVIKTYTVAGNSRFTVDVNGTAPELIDERFGARIDVTNGVAIAVERSVYWNANGVFWAGGSHATARPLP